MHGRVTARSLLLATGVVLAGCTEGPADPPRVDPSPGAAGHREMLELLEQIRERSKDEHYYFETRSAREMRQEVDRLGDRASWKLRLALGVAQLRLGQESVAIEELERAYELAHRPESKVSPPELSQVCFYLGVGYLRLGETQNCCERRTADSCILPIRGGGRHTRREGSEKAIGPLVEVLELSGEGSYGYRSAQWLLNIAYMTLGRYPDDVPERYRIPPSAFEAETDFPRFDNIAQDLHIDTFSLAGGVIVDDFDGDDYLDLVVSTWDTAGQIRFFVNGGDGTFVDRTEPAGLHGLYGGLNLVQADYDNDGDLDFLVLRGAWLGRAGRHPNSLVRNNGDGTFTDVTFDAGLGDVHYPTQTAAWADYDNDGDLDVYIGNENTARAMTVNRVGGDETFQFPCQLFRNNGDGTFTDVAAGAGVVDFGFAKAVAWGDIDGDGLPDLFVSNNGGENRLYRNKGDGTFEDIASRAGVAGPRDSFPAWFWDFDNDGRLDLFVSVYNIGIGELAAYFLGQPMEFELAGLYRGDGSGGFTNVARELGLTYPMLPMGANFGDVDGDGFLDFYLGTGDVNYFSLMPNVMFLNREARAFENVTMAGGVGHLQKGHGIAFADVDNDGDLDIFAQMGGAYPGDRFADAFFRNPGFGNHWITVKLIGRESNRSAIGARIRVDVEGADGERSIYRHVTSGGSFGASPLRQTIGLGRARRIRRIELLWPTTGRRQVFENVEPDQTIEIVEGDARYERLELERLVLPGGTSRAAAR